MGGGVPSNNVVHYLIDKSRLTGKVRGTNISKHFWKKEKLTLNPSNAIPEVEAPTAILKTVQQKECK